MTPTFQKCISLVKVEFNDVKSPFVLTASIEYILSTRGFDVPLPLTYFLMMQFIFSFYQEIALIFSTNLYY